MTLLDRFTAAVAAHPERVAIIDRRFGETRFAALDRRAASLASTFRAQGLRAGMRVLLAPRLDRDLYAGLAAIWRCGATAVFPEPQLGLPGLAAAVRASRPDALLALPVVRLLKPFHPALRPIPLVLRTQGGDGAEIHASVAGDAPALLSFTTGTTGRPKGIVRSHAFLLAQLDAVTALLRRPEPTVDLVAFPVFVLANLALGNTSVLPDWRADRVSRIAPERLRRSLVERRVARLLAPPALVSRLAEAGFPPSLREVLTGGGPVFPDVALRWLTSAPGVRFTAVYGSTEAEPIAETVLNDLDADLIGAMRGGSGLLAGRPAAGTRVRIRDDEIEVAGPHVVSGYLYPADDAETKRREGDTVWHRTGDAGRLDASGRLWLLGRLAARVGPLFPFTVEAAARSWPGVTNAVLVATARGPVLAVEGERRQIVRWREAARAFEGLRIIAVDAIPLDRRHRSKPDYGRLRRAIAAA